MIRVSVGIPTNQHFQSSMVDEEEEEEETYYSECSSAVTANAASCSRSLAIIVSKEISKYLLLKKIT